MPNKISHLWQEIERRNVHRSLAFYAGTSYVIFKAFSLIFPRWGLPDRAVHVVLYLLIAGLFIALSFHGYTMSHRKGRFIFGINGVAEFNDEDLRSNTRFQALMKNWVSIHRRQSKQKTQKRKRTLYVKDHCGIIPKSKGIDLGL